MSTDMTISVRQATKKDIPDIVIVEQRRWQPLGVPLYTEKHFEAWLDVHPAGFAVAVDEHKEIVGYTYAQFIDFAFDRIDQDFASIDVATDHGYTRQTHKPDGNAVYGLTITSTRRGAGHALYDAFYWFLESSGKQYYVGFPRLAGLDLYLRDVEVKGLLPPIDQELEKILALWYARACTKSVGGKIWPSCPSAPPLTLPEPPRDRILMFHLANRAFGLAAVIPNFMPDPAARNYGALHVYQLP